MMNILCVDTSTKTYCVAIVENNKIKRRRHKKAQRLLSATLIPTIKQLTLSAGLRIDQLDGFGIGLGPGSFTGLRVGLATVKGFVTALDKPVVALPSLDIIAAQAETDSKQICVISDARREMVYACTFVRENGLLKRRTDYTLGPLQDVLKELRGDVFFIGDGIALYEKEILKDRNIKASFSPGALWYPRAASLATCLYQRFEQKQWEDPDRLVPLYLYPQDCQIRHKAKAAR